MEEHDQFGFTPAPEHVDAAPAPFETLFKSPVGPLYTIPASPSRTHATPRLNEQVNEAGGSVPDYRAMQDDDPFKMPSRAPSKLGSVAGDRVATEVSQPLIFRRKH